MIDAERIYYMITDTSIRLPAKNAGNLSVFAFGGEAYQVNIKGAKYTAHSLDLTPDNPTAVSNSYIGNDVTISVEKGSVLIITDRS